jgi:hypothetical protein
LIQIIEVASEPKKHTMKVQWDVEANIHAYYTSALNEGELPGSRSGRFTPGKRSPDTLHTLLNFPQKY